MDNQGQSTFFDSPEKSSEEAIQRASKLINANPLIMQLLEGFPELAIIMDENRQIVALNKNAEEMFNNTRRNEIFGLRLGEALDCIHSKEMIAGCGTSQFCAECGAAKATRSARMEKKTFIEECRITKTLDNEEKPLDFRVTVTPFKHEEANYILFAIKDIADEKRRQNLERIFFHDVLNTAGAIFGIAQLLPESNNTSEFHEYGKMLFSASEHLINEINAQRDISKAEDGSLAVNFAPESINNILITIKNIFGNQYVAKNKTLEVTTLPEDEVINTDSVLLIRSIGNLVKNALEASPENNVIKVDCKVTPEKFVFNVYNNNVIPNDIQLNIFQRSFSTKATSGRGIGTYSIKLLIEQYLSGRVTFVSNEKVKTVFSITMPRR